MYSAVLEGFFYKVMSLKKVELKEKTVVKKSEYCALQKNRYPNKYLHSPFCYIKTTILVGLQLYVLFHFRTINCFVRA